MGATGGAHTAFVSAGTWLLVGREQAAPDLSEGARRANFTNELGALGGVRFLKNLAGSWLLEECRTAWGDPPLADLLRAAAGASADGALLDVEDPRFLHPDDMLTEVTNALGVPRETDPARVARLIIESQAAGTAAVVDQLGDVTHVAAFGGGAQSPLYLRALAERSGRTIMRGPVEATALGNALAQGIALGVYSDLTAARGTLATQ